MNDFLNQNGDNIPKENEAETVSAQNFGTEKTEEPVLEPIKTEATADNEPNNEFDGVAFTDFSQEGVADEPAYAAENNDFPKDVFTENIPIENPVNFSDVEPMRDHKPMSLGLKLFALIMAGVILLTGGCVAGYFMAQKTVPQTELTYKVPDVDLAARPADTDEMTVAQVYDKVNPSVVGIITYNMEGDGGTASGIIYSEDGYIVSNDHIYAEISNPKFKIYMADGTEYDAEYVAGDKISDLSVLKIKDNVKLKPAVFGNSDEVFPGQKVVAIGRPNGAENDSTVTDGVVSAVSERVRNATNYSARLIQTSCAINPGNSGGALVDMYGQIVGVTASKLAGTAYDNVGYAIPTTVMKRIVDELIKEGKVVSRAKLGITYAAINSALAEINGYQHTGLYIDSVSEDSALYGKAEKGDFITHINGIEVTSDKIVLDIIEKCSAGDTITVTIITSTEETKTIKAVLKANIGESSYVTGKITQSEKDEASGGTFDFPFGE